MDGPIGLAVILALYFIPTVVAVKLGHHNRVAIFTLNLLLGWTLIGWVIALVWAVLKPRAAP